MGSCQIGTFIIRFRYKQPKSIAISYKLNANQISNIKCDLSPNNDSTFICGKKSMPLPQFIASFQPLKFLYGSNAQSSVAKETIFTLQNNQTMNVPAWSSSSSWNPPNNNAQQQQHQPSMNHAPTANPYMNNNHKNNHYSQRHFSPQPGMQNSHHPTYRQQNSTNVNY